MRKWNFEKESEKYFYEFIAAACILSGEGEKIGTYEYIQSETKLYLGMQPISWVDTLVNHYVKDEVKKLEMKKYGLIAWRLAQEESKKSFDNDIN